MKRVFLAAVITAVAAFGFNAEAAFHNSINLTGKSSFTSFDTTKTDSALIGTWKLHVSPALKSIAETPVITFNKDNTFSGNTGCNNMSGSFSVDGKQIILGPDIIVTKKACPGYNEKAFITNLTQTNAYQIKGKQLQLMNGSNVLSTWIKQDNTTDSTNNI